MVQNASEKNQSFEQPERGIDILEAVRLNARERTNVHKLIVGTAKICTRRLRSNSNDQAEALAALFARNVTLKKSSEG